MTTFGTDSTGYIVVTPVKDEERYIERTLESVVNQTIRPACWVVVDDGSTDGTPVIIKKYAHRYDWIAYLRIERTNERLLGSAEIRAFTVGYENVCHLEHGYVVKLDADLELPSDYFERMFARFQNEPNLGVASGAYLEEQNGSWKPIELPEYHAAGAAKMVRRQCFRDIEGFVLFPGWDTVDEIKAWTCGWKTCHFPEIQFYHLKPEGSAMGHLRTNFFHGEIYYASGGGVLFLTGKVLRRLIKGKPFLLCGAMLLCGYIYAAITRRPKLVTSQQARVYNRLLNRRITEWFTTKPSALLLK